MYLQCEHVSYLIKVLLRYAALLCPLRSGNCLRQRIWSVGGIFMTRFYCTVNVVPRSSPVRAPPQFQSYWRAAHREKACIMLQPVGRRQGVVRCDCPSNTNIEQTGVSVRSWGHYWGALLEIEWIILAPEPGLHGCEVPSRQQVSIVFLCCVQEQYCTFSLDSVMNCI